MELEAVSVTAQLGSESSTIPRKLDGLTLPIRGTESEVLGSWNLSQSLPLQA